MLRWKTDTCTLCLDEADGGLLGLETDGFHIPLEGALWGFDSAGRDGGTRAVAPSPAFTFTHYAKSGTLHLLWEKPGTKVEVRIWNLEGQMAMKIAVVLPEGEALGRVRFPILGGLPTLSENGADDRLLLPWQNGFVIRDPLHTLLDKQEALPFWCGRGGRKYENEYPAQYSYQFSAYYAAAGGLFFGTRDSGAHIMTVGYYLREDALRFDYRITQYPEDMGRCRRYTSPYPAMLAFFRGDWQDAAALYRPWAVRQPWCGQTLREKLLPENLTKTDLWRINHTNYAFGTRTGEYVETCRLLQERLACRLAVHWYGWNMGRHDYEYPEYINPALADWPDKLTAYNRQLTQAGIVKIPYVNARLWDSHIPAWEEEQAVLSAVKNEEGGLPDEPWNSGTVLRPMCPAAGPWREKVVEFGEKYVERLSFDGLYLDQVASYNATLCFDPSHGHPVGGGTWWGEAYHQMIRQLRSQVGDDSILTSESCCEIYGDVFDLFLVLDTTSMSDTSLAGWLYSEPVPLFNMLYGAHMLTYGSVCRLSDTLPQFEFHLTRNTLWGILPSVEGFSLEEMEEPAAEPYFAVLRSAVVFYQEHREDMLYSRIDRVLDPACPALPLEWTAPGGEVRTKSCASVQATRWERPDGSRFITAYNWSDAPVVSRLEETEAFLPPHSFLFLS